MRSVCSFLIGPFQFLRRTRVPVIEQQRTQWQNSPAGIYCSGQKLVFLRSIIHTWSTKLQACSSTTSPILEPFVTFKACLSTNCVATFTFCLLYLWPARRSCSKRTCITANRCIEMLPHVSWWLVTTAKLSTWHLIFYFLVCCDIFTVVDSFLRRRRDWAGIASEDLCGTRSANTISGFCGGNGFELWKRAWLFCMTMNQVLRSFPSRNTIRRKVPAETNASSAFHHDSMAPRSVLSLSL